MRALIFCSLLFVNVARADKEQRALALFASSCASCHALGHHGEPAKLHHPERHKDLTRSAKNHDEKWLRRWLRDPQKVDPKSKCRITGMDPVLEDAIVSLLMSRGK